MLFRLMIKFEHGCIKLFELIQIDIDTELNNILVLYGRGEEDKEVDTLAYLDKKSSSSKKKEGW